jgi:adenylate cyclase
LLTKVEGKFVLDTFEYEEKMASIFRIQDLITQALTEKLRVHFEARQAVFAKKRETQNMEAYDFYTRGKYFERVYMESQKEEDFQSAAIWFNKAVEIDPDYALAYVGLGNIHECRFVNKNDDKDLDKLRVFYKTAYEKNPDIADTNIGLGWYYYYIKDFDKAFEYNKKAFWIDPNNPKTNQEIGHLFRSIELYQKAVYYYKRAVELDPSFLDPESDPRYIDNYMFLARCYRLIGELDKADASMKELISRAPEDLGVKLRYARLLIWKGEYIEAEEIIARVEEADPTFPAIKYPRALAFAVRGKKNEALAFIEDIESYALFPLITNVYAALGMKEDTYRMIEDGIKNGYEKLQQDLFGYHYLMNNPFFDILRNDSRFQEILLSQKRKFERLLLKYRDL